MNKCVVFCFVFFLVRKSGPCNGVFKYFITRGENQSQMYISLSDVYNKDIKVSTKHVLKIVQNLSHCLGLLHKSSLKVNIEDRYIYVNVVNNKVSGKLLVTR
jgi:hypothetical protein